MTEISEAIAEFRPLSSGWPIDSVSWSSYSSSFPKWHRGFALIVGAYGHTPLLMNASLKNESPVGEIPAGFYRKDRHDSAIGTGG